MRSIYNSCQHTFQDIVVNTEYHSTFQACDEILWNHNFSDKIQIISSMFNWKIRRGQIRFNNDHDYITTANIQFSSNRLDVCQCFRPCILMGLRVE